MKQTNVLIVDDDLIVVEIIKSIVTNAGYRPVVAMNSTILSTRRVLDFDTIILDLWLSDGHFESSLQALAQVGYKGGVILVSGLHCELFDAAQMATNLGLDLLSYIHKPIRSDILLTALARMEFSVAARRAKLLAPAKR